MYISSIELENIKSHKRSLFEFERGTTAILGENGAGKTTLIEAVAWTIFDLLDYKKDSFRRRGSKRGVARVTFESGLDERPYVVHRDTGTGYYVYDPGIKTRIADKKEEVQRFLWKHIGVEPGTDLESLFRGAIGVPQGTLTAIFLETPAARKKAFDKLLKVEEYRQSAERLIDTVNLVKSRQVEVDNRIAFAEGNLGDFKESEKALKELIREEKELTKKVGKSGKEIEKLGEKLAGLAESGRRLEELNRQASDARQAFAREEVKHARLVSELAQSEGAAEVLKSVKEGHSRHLKALGMLKELEREASEREKLIAEIGKIDGAIGKVEAEKESVAKDLEKIAKARSEITRLEPQTKKQSELEDSIAKLRNELTDARSAADRLEAIVERITALRRRYVIAQEDLKQAKALSKGAEALAGLIKEEDSLRNRLNGLQGRLEVDRKFQSGLKEGVCPILTEKCLNLKEGETLEGFLSEEFSRIEKEIREADTAIAGIRASISDARKAQDALSSVEPLEKRFNEISEEGKRLKEESEALRKPADAHSRLKTALERAERELSALDNPKGRLKLLSDELAREIPLRDKETNIDSNLERLTSEKRLKTEHLESYKDLDFNRKKYSAERDQTIKDYSAFLANEPQAGKLSERKEALKDAEKESSRIKSSLKEIEALIAKAAKDYDAPAHERLRTELIEKEKQAAADRANLANVSERRADLAERIGKLKKIKGELEADKKQRERLKGVYRTTAFIRSTLKEAAPRVAKNYVYHVSNEANQMFRDITGNAERTLIWAEDYGISLEEGGFERPFQNLSGGEQMAAALSVRLALLKQLSDINLAFFDEPTVNLDLERRERLAEEISRITDNRTFEQMFVISHDDTFESYVDNVIVVEAGEDD